MNIKVDIKVSIISKMVKTLKVKLIHENAKVPFKAHESDAGYDITSVENVTIPPNDKLLISTGVCVLLPKNYHGKLFSRSGLASKFNLEVGAGVIDQGYTGEIKVLLRNLGNKEYEVNVGDKIAQMIIYRYLSPNIELLEESSTLDSTDRGAKGFGSSGL